MRSLQTRLLLAVGVLAVAAVAAVAFSARLSTRQEFERFQNIERITDMREIGGIEASLVRAAESLNDTCCATDAMAQAAGVLARQQALLAFDADGRLLASAGAGVADPNLRASLRDGLLDIDTTSAGDGTRTGMKVAIKGGPTRVIRSRDGAAVTLVVVKMPEASADTPAGQFLGSVDRRRLIVTAVDAALALLITLAITRRIVGPIAELRDATRDLAPGQLSRRVPASGADESPSSAADSTRWRPLERQEDASQSGARRRARAARRSPHCAVALRPFSTAWSTTRSRRCVRSTKKSRISRNW
jgi:HAMP domain-containing protein